MMKYTLNLDDDLHREFKIYCVTNGIDMSEVMRSLIREFLDRSYTLGPAKARKKQPRQR